MKEENEALREALARRYVRPCAKLCWLKKLIRAFSHRTEQYAESKAALRERSEQVVFSLPVL